MAAIGLSFPYAAEYNVDNEGNVTYTNGMVLGKAITFSTSIEEGKDNNLYGDNGIAESDGTFGGGEATIGTDDLMEDASALIVGITAQPITVNGTETTELIYDDDVNPPDLGLGVVIKKKKGGALKWRGVVLTKIKFSIFDESADTQGESIDWKTPEITATIMRDDSVKHAWKREATFDTEAEARAYLKQILGVKETGI